MNLEQLFGKWFAFLRDSLNGRTMIVAVKSDTVDDPAGEGWIMVTQNATVKALPAGNPGANPVTLSLLANQIIPVKFRRVYESGTDPVTVYIIK